MDNTQVTSPEVRAELQVTYQKLMKVLSEDNTIMSAELSPVKVENLDGTVEVMYKNTVTLHKVPQLAKEQSTQQVTSDNNKEDAETTK